MEGDFKVGGWLVRPDLNRIEREGEKRSLVPKVMDVLVYLADHAGDVLHKERVIQAVWPDIFVTDDVLKHSIFELRKAFEDNAQNPSFIETIPRRGYRLIAPVVNVSQLAESRYRVGEAIGRGAMGEVFLGEDQLLKRKVALKFLVEELADDERARRRFLREARAAAALVHPFICSVHDTGELEGRTFIAMEYLEGQTLKDRLGDGPLPLTEALKIASEVTEALEKAHTAGIIHRDLKPANVMLTSDRHAKVMDFGLAKQVVTEDGSIQDISSTVSREWTVVGTLSYMSPEQVKGDPVDHRSDIFSLGVIFYEMLTGVHPFRKAAGAETISAILTEDPASLAEFRQDCPLLLQHMISKMLARNPEHRHQTMKEVQDDLALVVEDSGSTLIISRLREIRWSRAAVPAVLLVVLAAALVWWSSREPDRGPMEPLKITPFTSDGGLKNGARFSPDGQRVAYNWNGPARDNWDIWVKALWPGSEAQQLTDHPNRDFFPAWSPDGRKIAFVRLSEDSKTAAVYEVPSMGGHARKIVDWKGPLWNREILQYALFWIQWSPDGKSLIFAEADAPDAPARIVQMSIATLEKEVLTFPQSGTLGDWFPRFSPDGSLIAFVRSSSETVGKLDIWVQSLKDGEARRLTNLEFAAGGSPTWTSDGRSIVFCTFKNPEHTQFWRVDIQNGAPILVGGLGQDVLDADVWGDRLIFTMWSPAILDIYRIPKSTGGNPGPERLIHSSYSDTGAEFSPDGTQIVFQSLRSGSWNIWKCKSDGSEPMQLTFFDEGCHKPGWSPDGKRIVFHSPHSGNWDLWLVDPEGGEPKQLTTNSVDERSRSWSRDGQWIYFCSLQDGKPEIAKIPSQGGEAIRIIPGGMDARESMDGQYLYYTKADNPGLWRYPLSGESEEVQVLSEFRDWDVGERGIYFSRVSGKLPGVSQSYRILFLDFETDEDTELYRTTGDLGHLDLTVSPDENWLLFSRSPADGSELMLAENFR